VLAEGTGGGRGSKLKPAITPCESRARVAVQRRMCAQETAASVLREVVRNTIQYYVKVATGKTGKSVQMDGITINPNHRLPKITKKKP